MTPKELLSKTKETRDELKRFNRQVDTAITNLMALNGHLEGSIKLLDRQIEQFNILVGQELSK